MLWTMSIKSMGSYKELTFGYKKSSLILIEPNILHKNCVQLCNAKKKIVRVVMLPHYKLALKDWETWERTLLRNISTLHLQIKCNLFLNLTLVPFCGLVSLIGCFLTQQHDLGSPWPFDKLWTRKKKIFFYLISSTL